METAFVDFESPILAGGVVAGVLESTVDSIAHGSATNSISEVHTEYKSVNRFAHLEPVGSCYFCNKQVDNIRRFCSKSCSQEYANEVDGT